MAIEWREVLLGEVADIFDGPHATPPKTAAGPVFLGISNLVQGRLDLSATEHLSEEDYLRWTRRVTPAPGDVVFSYETRLGEAAAIPQGLRCCLGRRMGLLRAKPSRVDSRFLLYAYLGREFQETLRAHTVHGSTVDRIPLIDMGRFPIRIPISLDQQRAIAYILGALDDKIELNRRMSQTLEAMAQALFISWFAGLDVLSARAEEMELEGILEIGDGYRAKNTELGKPGMPFIRAGDLNGGFDTHAAEYLHETSVAKAGSKVARVGDVAFTSKGTIGRFARVDEHSVPFVYSPQVCFWRSRQPTRLHPAILYAWMQSTAFIEQVMAVAGQTDMAPYVSLRDQRRMLIPRFPVSQSVIGDRIQALLRRQSLASNESRVLVALRDTLLPKLISGELRVRDADHIVGGLS